MAASKYLISDDVGMPKWKLALAIGGAAALCAGIYYKLCISRSSPKDSKTGRKTAKPSSPKAKNGVQTPSIEDTSPLGIAKKHKGEGNDHYRNGEYLEAINCYDAAIKACPPEATQDLATFYQNKAAANELLKDWASVLRDCSSALELNPHYSKALNRRAKAAEILLDRELALEDYTALCILESFANASTLQIVDRLLKEIGMEHAKEVFGKPLTKLPSKYKIRPYLNTFCSDPVYKDVLSEKEPEEDPSQKNPVINGYVRALQHMREERYDEVIACCNNELATPTSPYTAHALLLRGTMYVLLMDRENAKRDFNRLAAMEDVPPQFRAVALAKLGSMEVSYDNSDEALVIYNRALNIDPKNPDVYHQRGQMFLMMNNIDAAIENFNKVVELEPNFSIGYIQKLHTDYRAASVKKDIDGVKKVIDAFEEAKTKFPKCSELYLLLAQIYMDDEKFEQADELFEELLANEPENPLGHLYRGMLYVQWKTDIQQAKSLMRKALKIDSTCELAIENLATICVQTGNLQEGVDLFNQVIPLAKSLQEAAHYCSLRDAALAQIKVVKRLGISLPGPMDM